MLNDHACTALCHNLRNLIFTDKGSATDGVCVVVSITAQILPALSTILNREKAAERSIFDSVDAKDGNDGNANGNNVR